MLIRKEFRFEAAHAIEDYPGPCRSLHGHSYRLRVFLEGEADPVTGMVLDFNRLAQVVRSKVLSHLDHRFLNELVPIPTSENLATWIWRQLRADLPGLASIELHETEQNCVILGRAEGA